ncbi:MAG: hypothetical protein MAGBODY4_00466 [Candidatus Marinimicrobia bacterium]|nr:hypothetical protein [Candidatus Neomarinimicrobiota bacterium]
MNISGKYGDKSKCSCACWNPEPQHYQPVLVGTTFKDDTRVGTYTGEVIELRRPEKVTGIKIISDSEHTKSRKGAKSLRTI